MKEIGWSKTGDVETQHAKDSDMSPSMTVDEAIEEIRDLSYGLTPTHKSDLEKNIRWKFDPNNLSRVARALELMLDSGELEEDEEEVIHHNLDIDTKEVRNMVEIKVEKTFRAGGKEYEEGETYEVSQKIADAVERKGYASEKLGERKKRPNST